jgi:hypothetical protein
MSKNVRFFAGTKEQYLKLSHSDRALYFCGDTNELFWGTRLISDGLRVVEALPDYAAAADGVIYFVNKDGAENNRNGYVLNAERNAWVQVIYAPTNSTGAPTVELDNYYTKTEVESLVNKAIDELDIPDVTGLIKDIPDYYITESELDRCGYITAQALNDYVLKTELTSKIAEVKELIPSVEGLASETWVESKNYLTAKDISNKADNDHNHDEVYEKKGAAQAAADKVKEELLNGAGEAFDTLVELGDLINTNQDAIESLRDIATGKADKNHSHTEYIGRQEFNEWETAFAGDLEDVYAMKSAIPTKVSQLTNDSNFLTAIPSDYITETALNAKYYATEAFVTTKIEEAQLSKDEPVDLANYVTKDEIKDFITAVPDEYVTENELTGKGFITSQDLDDYAKRSELFSGSYEALTDKPVIPSTEGLASEDYVNEAIKNIPEVDLSKHALRSELPTKTSELLNDSNFITKTALETELDNRGYLTSSALDGKADADHTHDEYALSEHEHANYAKVAELFSGSYDDLTNKPEIPSIEGLATKDELNAIKIPTKLSELTNDANYVTEEILTGDISNKADKDHTHTEYATVEHVHEDYAKTTDMFSGSYDDLTDKPDIFTQQETLNTIETHCTEVFCHLNELKANDKPFANTTASVVTNAIGAFEVNEDIKDYTIAQILAKLLGITSESGPVEPENPDNPDVPSEPTGVIDTIIAKTLPMYSITSDGVVAETQFEHLVMTEEDAAAEPTKTGFYQINNTDGTTEYGYQELQADSDDFIYVIALPKVVDYDTMVSLKVYDMRNSVWTTGEKFEMISDPDEVASICDEYGIDISAINQEEYTIYVWEDLPSGSKLRYVITE